MTTPNDLVIDLDSFREWLNKTKLHISLRPIDDEKYGAIQGHLTKLFGDNRRKFFAWAFSVDTPDERKELSQARRAALWTWLSPQYDSDLNVWLIRDQCHRTATALLRQWEIEAGQASLIDDGFMTDAEKELVEYMRIVREATK